VTNGLGCSANASRTITVNALPVPNVEGINTICAGQSTILTAVGGNTYAWQHGASSSVITVNPTSTTTYKVTVTNAAGCSAIYNRTVRVNATPVAEILGLPSNPVCGDSTLTLTASGIGAYSWNTGETSATIQPLITGKRSVVLVVKNANACADTAQAEILFNTRPVAQIVGGEIACYGNSTVLTAGQATSYRWNTGATSASINIVAPLQTATYTVTLSNGLGCSVSVEKVVRVPDALSLSYQLDKDKDCIAKNVSIIPQASGGQGSKTFTLLRSGELYPNADLSGWGSGEYVLVGKDSMGCVATKAVSIHEPDSLKVSVQQVSGALDCTLGNNAIQASVQHSRGSVQFSIWGTSTEYGASALFNNVHRGTQIVEARDSVGCVDTASIRVKEWVPVQITQVQMLHHTDCTPGNTGARIVTTSSGRTLLYQKEDAAPQAIDSFANLQKGYHQVIVSDSLGCKDTSNVLVLDDAFPYCQVSPPTDCDSANAVIRFSRAAYNSKLEYSLDYGATWSSSRTFEKLTPGHYCPAIRAVDDGCIHRGDSITIGEGCPIQPRAGFIKDSIVVSDPKQLVALQWFVESPLWFKDTFNVVLLRKGQFSPHFNELSAWNSPVVVDAEYPGAVNLQQAFELILADTLGKYTQLTEYYFELIAPVGSPVLVDPQHKVMKVIVNFGDGCLSEPDPIVVCQGQEVRIGQTHIKNPECIEWSHSSSEALELVFKAEEDGDYTQTVVDADGNVCIAHYKVRIKNPTVKIESAQKDGACPQDLVELKAEHEGVAKSYKWELIIKDEPGAAPAFMGSTRIIQVSPGYEYQVNVTFSSGCTAHASI
jgi:hypothetical protein